MDATDIEQLFAGPVMAQIATPAMAESYLFPEEHEAVARAGEKRRREFMAGRACARAALGRLGLAPPPLPVLPHRAPAWPDGVVGSLTHCAGFCCAVVARRDQLAAVGVDAESDAPLATAVMRRVCRPDELAHFAAQERRPVPAWAKLAFSAKEALFKAYHPLTLARLDFHDVALRFFDADGGGVGRFTVALAPGRPLAAQAAAFEGRWRLCEGRVHTGTSVAAGAMASG